MHGPRQERRKLMAEVVKATIVSGAFVWKTALMYKRIQRLYQLCARKFCADHRMTIAGMILNDVRAKQGMCRAESPNLQAG